MRKISIKSELVPGISSRLMFDPMIGRQETVTLLSMIKIYNQYNGAKRKKMYKEDKIKKRFEKKIKVRVRTK